MQRWHKEIAKMKIRLNFMKEMIRAQNDFNEHSFYQKGIYRKSRPLSNDTLRSWRRIGQYIARQKNKKERQWKYIEKEHD